MLWNGEIGHKYRAHTSYQLGKLVDANNEEVTDVTTQQVANDARGFGLLSNGFLTYTTQTDCILFIQSGDTSNHVGDGFSIYTIEGGNLKFEIFRSIEHFKGIEPGFSFQLPTKKGSVIGIAFQIVKFKLMLEKKNLESEGWTIDSPFVSCDVTQDPDLVTNATVTNRTWEYMKNLANRNSSFNDLNKYPEGIFPAMPYMFEVTEMPLV